MTITHLQRGQAHSLRQDAPVIFELLSLMHDIEERVRYAPPVWQSAWADLRQDIYDLRRAIEMSRWGHGRIDAEIDSLQRRCQQFQHRLSQECPTIRPWK